MKNTELMQNKYYIICDIATENNTENLLVSCHKETKSILRKSKKHFTELLLS